MELKVYDIVLVVLVYRNMSDIKDFFQNLHILNCKVVIVNSYFDDITEIGFKKIAEDNGADFISVPNKGYGFGNNRGIEYALNHYQFDYLIVSNADVIVETLEINGLKKYGNAIIAPKILNLRGKNQNPSSPFAPCKIIEWMKFLCYKNHMRKTIFLFYAYSRLTKIIFYCIKGIRKNVFSAHGAFVIFPYNIVNNLFPFYNENMFLFNEEEHLGRLAKEKGFSTVYAPEIVVRHKEDGSMSAADVDIFERMRQSYMVYYNYWVHRS